MPFYPMNEYTLMGYRKSHRTGKKYDAIIKRISDGKLVHIPFGDLTYEHYRDSTPLRLYSRLDHMDANRRRLYKIRHAKDIRPGYYSPGYFSMKYLW